MTQAQATTHKHRHVLRLADGCLHHRHHVFVCDYFLEKDESSLYATKMRHLGNSHLCNSARQTASGQGPESNGTRRGTSGQRRAASNQASARGRASSLLWGTGMASAKRGSEVTTCLRETVVNDKGSVNSVLLRIEESICACAFPLTCRRANPVSIVSS